MLQRLRESKSAQGTFLALPTTIWLFILLIIPSVSYTHLTLPTSDLV